jgi:hypothetical protein
MVGMANQKKKARFLTHDLTKELAYVRTQNWHNSIEYSKSSQVQKGRAID